MPPTMSVIALIGYRGSGKTTLGRFLAEALDVPFVDSDEAVLAETGYGRVPDAWAALGEDGWREREAVIVPRLLRGDGVVALGGGAVLLPEVAEALAGARVVWLRASARVLRDRIAAGDDRPPLCGASAVDEVDAVLAEREPLYSGLANATIDTSGSLADASDAMMRAVS